MTYCTGNRAPSASVGTTGSTVSRCPSSVGPSYHGIDDEGSTTLSPARADTGIAVTSAMSRAAASSANSALMASKRAPSWPTRSILLTATTTWGTRSSDINTVCRRVCSTTPWRASTSTIATSAVDAPVMALRVYWAWPGQSAMTKSRAGVEK